jgi:hypothetical protein
VQIKLTPVARPTALSQGPNTSRRKPKRRLPRLRSKARALRPALMAAKTVKLEPRANQKKLIKRKRLRKRRFSRTLMGI